MAHLVNEALNKYAPEVIGASGISESVRQVSSSLIPRNRAESSLRTGAGAWSPFCGFI